jgi:hypothetical protein
MRVVWATFLATVPLAIVVAKRLPRLDPAAATPMAVTLVALGASIWIAFSAERDARHRLERAKRAFAVHGDSNLLLRSHLFVFLTVMIRLEVIVFCGIVTAVWGSGPRVAIWFALLAGLMMLLAWPTEHKVRLLLARGREVRDER